MEAVATLEQFAKLMGLHLVANASSKERILSHLMSAYTISTLATFAVSSGVKGIAAFPDNIDELTYALAECMVSCALLFAYIDFAGRKHVIAYLISETRAIANQTTEASEIIHQRTHWVAKWPIIISGGCFVAIQTISFVFFAMRDIIRGQFEPSTWYFTIIVATPYSRETVPGIILFYFQHLSLDWPFAGTLWFCAAFFACIGMYLDRFGEHFVGIFHKMDYSSKYESANRRSKTADELRNLMRAAINFQARLLRLYDRLAHTMSVCIFFHLIVGAFNMAMCVFRIFLSLDSPFMYTLLEAFITLMIVSNVLPYCYFSTRIVTSHRQLNAQLWQTHWYRLPVKHQKHFLMVVLTSQRRYTITGLGIVESSMESFLAIVRTAASYFLMVKNL